MTTQNLPNPRPAVPQFDSFEEFDKTYSLAFRWVCIMEFMVDPLKATMEDVINWAGQLEEENKNPMHWTLSECLDFLEGALIEDYSLEK